jgi:UDP-N-acetylglucosamine diphosphorylase / glucose-1-phosphate thymidylyltransferase / UDP-N-acetylgalactosamine diphosphorylase / glucosamine-1-phosphate N-acetyltransferase / galactosamine-1-phosphate N-acetyltransferase
MPKTVQQAVIIAAGSSTRTHPLTLSTPKPMLPVCGLPLICHNLKALAGAGISKVIIVVGYRRDQIQCTLGTEQFGIELVYVRQEERNGTATAVKVAQPYLHDDSFLLLMGDDLYQQQALTKLTHCKSNTALAAKVDDPLRFGVFTTAPEAPNLPTNLVEKPASGSYERWVNTGAYLFTFGLFDLMDAITPSPRGEYELTDAIKLLIRKAQFRLLLGDAQMGRVWQSVGYPWELLDAFDFLKGNQAVYVHPEARVVDNARLAGRINIEKGARIDEGAVLFDCYIGVDAHIGKRVNLRSCIIGMGAEIGDETHGDDHAPEGETVDTYVAGKPATSHRTMLGAIVGDYAQVGAEVQLAPGTVVWQMARVPAGAWAEGLIY